MTFAARDRRQRFTQPSLRDFCRMRLAPAPFVLENARHFLRPHGLGPTHSPKTCLRTAGPRQSLVDLEPQTAIRAVGDVVGRSLPRARRRRRCNWCWSWRIQPVPGRPSSSLRSRLLGVDCRRERRSVGVGATAPAAANERSCSRRQCPSSMLEAAADGSCSADPSPWLGCSAPRRARCR